MVLDLQLDRSGPWPLRQQLHAQLAASIRQGAIRNGERLPASRVLAAVLGVSRNTVVEAYERLLQEGLITSRQGSGMRVNDVRSRSISGVSSLQRLARAAHYPEGGIHVVDPDGMRIYLDAVR